jgi:RNA polymerase sigma-70 factor (sigma-E family)
MSTPASFHEFVELRSRSLLRTAWLLTGDWAAAEDLLQVALVASWRRWDSILRVDAREVYVHKVLARSYLRSRSRRWSGEIPTDALPEAEVDDKFLAVDVRSSIVQTVRQLPPRQRAVIALRYLADLSEAQTAQALGCSVGTIKSQTNKALARLRLDPALRDLMNGEAT